MLDMCQSWGWFHIGFHIYIEVQGVLAHFFVVATTCRNSTRSLLTSAKLTEGYLVVGITRELDKEPLLHCSSIYINTTWSMLQQYLPALMSMHCPHVLLLIHHKATMPYTYALMSYSLISVVHVCTMCTP